MQGHAPDHIDSGADGRQRIDARLGALACNLQPGGAASSLTLLDRSGATLSSTFGSYGARLTIDDDMSSFAVSGRGEGNWLSVGVPGRTPIGYVALYNIQDRTGYWPAELGVTWVHLTHSLSK